jgi:spermidine synthase
VGKHESGAAPVPRWSGALVYGMFFVSGAAALIYQTVWIRQFSLVMGGTVFSMSVVVSTFMAGLALGAAALGRLADRARSPLRLYAAVELLIGACALALNAGGPWRERMVTALIRTPDLPSTLGTRLAIAALWLGLPCFLIGGTLPVMARFVVRDLDDLGKKLGALYFVNTLGAALGALLTGAALIELLGLTGATRLAASLNAAAAAAALTLGRVVPASRPSPAARLGRAVARPRLDRTATVAALAFFLSGFCALVLEMGWTRLILSFLHAGALSVSLNLALVLLGFALGGAAAAPYADASRAPARLAGALFALAAALTLLGMGDVELLGLLPESVFVPSLGQFAAVVGIVFPASVAMGAAFPVLARMLVTSRERVGSQLGAYYALNTAGAVLGGIAAPFLLIPRLGTAGTLIAACVLQLAAAAVLVSSAPRVADARLRYAAPALIVAALLLIPGRRDVYHRALQESAQRFLPEWSRERAYAEGADSTVILYDANDPAAAARRGLSRFRLQVNASKLVAYDSNETKLMAHLPLAAAPDARRALVICFGVGNTFRSALAHGVDTDVVDINPLVPNLARLHQADPSKTFDDPRGRIWINDGRNYLLTTRARYDMITVDPAPPAWGMGMGNIQSREFYRLVADRLTDAGVAEAWMLSSDSDDFRSTLAAFREAFPHVAIFKSDRTMAFHVLGSRAPIRFSRARLAALFKEPRLRADLAELDASYFSPALFGRLYITDENGADRAIASAAPLTDDRPALEYRALRGFRSAPYIFPPELRKPLPLGP